MYGMPEDQMPVVTMKGGSTPLVNADPLAGRIAAALEPLLGKGNVSGELPSATASEDFHLLKSPYEDTPLNMVMVGIADPKLYQEAMAKTGAPPYAVHNPGFKVDLNAVPVGAKTATVAMLELLRKP